MRQTPALSARSRAGRLRGDGSVAPRLNRVLDIGCGGGHVTYRLAPHVDHVTAFDVTSTMLDAVASEAAARGFSNVGTRLAPAEALPFEEATFDAVFCRFTTHHWSDITRGLQEARRVLVPGGVAVFADIVAPANPLHGSWLQSLELLRDISHVRDYTIAEWVAHLGQAGFAVTSFDTHGLRMEFDRWIARTRTPQIRADAIRSLLRDAPQAVTQHFSVEPDGSFTPTVGLFRTEPQ